MHGSEDANGWCQTKANWSQIARLSPCLGGKLPPFGQRVFSVLLEPVSVVDVAFEIEVIVDGRVDSGELLKASHSPESEHRPLASS